MRDNSRQPGSLTVKPIRVLVADAYPMSRAGVKSALARESGFKVAEAANLGELLERAVEQSPDIVLVDAAFPPSGAPFAVSRLSERVSAEIIVWGFEPSGEEIVAAIRSGASGYLPKNISTDGFVRAMRRVSQGEAAISRDLVMALVEGIHALKEWESTQERAALLSDREREVLALVAGGARNKRIGAVLYISELTVKRHVQNILHKLELPSRQAAAEFYLQTFRDDLWPPADQATTKPGSASGAASAESTSGAASS